MSLESPEQKLTEYFSKIDTAGVLRFITCGSVDDGKSTVIGRLLFDSRNVFDDQMASIIVESKRYGTQGNEPDLALLVDGLQAEREQGITIDVAYRFFSTDKRRYIVADTPGHKQYTRNMATGASTADLAMILIDSRIGIVEQTRRHARIVKMLGIQKVVAAVNKMDLVDYSQSHYGVIAESFAGFAQSIGIQSVTAIPMSGLRGDNVFSKGENMAWYEGPTLIEYLDEVEITEPLTEDSFQFQVQWVNRPNPDFRGYCGMVSRGTVRVGDPLLVMPANLSASVQELYLGDRAVDSAGAGDAAQIVLSDEIEVGRGDVLSSVKTPAVFSDQFCAKLLWLSESHMQPGRQYHLKLGYKKVTASVSEVKYLEDIDTGVHLAAKSLKLNDIALVNISLNEKINFEPYAANRSLGAFILIDSVTNQTIGSGMVEYPLRRASNLSWQDMTIDRELRASQKNQSPKCFWLTGLSGSGKSTIANVLDQKLSAAGKHVFILDGDNVRHGLNKDLGFTETDRVENVRRIAEVAKLMADAGLIVIVSFISPFRSEREMAKRLFLPDEFLEVFVDTSLEECQNRDVKGLYAKAREGKLLNFTGIDSPYEAPTSPDIHLRTELNSPEECAELIMQNLK